MNQIHCHSCGGFITDTTTITYAPPLTPSQVAEPRSALCDCSPPLVFGPPPGHMSSPGMPAVGRVSASREL